MFEPIDHRSLVSNFATGIIAGLGALGDELAIEAVQALIKRKMRGAE
jgi:3-dehydroquinate dehydratase-2